LKFLSPVLELLHADKLTERQAFWS